jgi:hypothetical protein
VADQTFSTIIVTCPASDLSTQQPLCLDWVKRWIPDTTETAADMLPFELSPTGSPPATLNACALQLTQEQIDDMNTFIGNNSMVVTVSNAGTQDDGRANTLANFAAWLTANSLAEIS